MYKQVATIVSMLVLASGCADSTTPSNGDPAKVTAPPITVPNKASAVRERTVVNLTDSAIAKFREFLAAEPTKHIRLSVKNEGPTGFMYDLQIDQSISDSDFVDRSHGFTLVVDPKSSLYLGGTTIDWQTQSDGQAGFKFDNPNAVQQ